MAQQPQRGGFFTGIGEDYEEESSRIFLGNTSVFSSTD